MSKFLRRIALSNWKLAFTAMTLALLLLIVASDLIVRNNGVQASGIEQNRVYQVKALMRRLKLCVSKLKQNLVMIIQLQRGLS